jgi:2-polyprenyl-3-methyl-5-hydroxy-6-metoxy-1,4-benzoquinol methylase
MASIIDERGFNQGYELTTAQKIRIKRRASVIVFEMHLPTNPGETLDADILEVGCGTGELSLELAKITGARVTGMDLSQKFIDYAIANHHYPNLRFLVADLDGSPSKPPPEKYDYIVGNGILHHLYSQLDHFLPMLGRWLVPGGRIIFWEPNLRNPYVFLIFKVAILRRMARLEPDEMAFTPKFVRKKLQAAGFSHVRAIPRDFLLPNTPVSLISTVIKVGDLLERVPVLRACAQSVFLTATFT